MGLEEFAEDGGGVFAEFTVVGAEGGEEVGVDIEFAGDFAADEDGNDDFGFGFDQDAETQVRGLGLISMHERARLAGGILTVKSELGEGTTVVADLPLEPHA